MGYRHGIYISELATSITPPVQVSAGLIVAFGTAPVNQLEDPASWICPYISRHLLSLNPLQARCRRYSRGER